HRLSALLAAALLAACGENTAITVIAVSITPAAASTTAGGTVQFTGTVTGSTDTRVIWSVKESSGGQISASGLYQAPAAVGTYHVVATSTADTSKSASAELTVQAPPPPVAVTIAPETITVDHDATQQFTASVTGATNTAVSWSVTESTGGTVDSSGLYTAPH